MGVLPVRWTFLEKMYTLQKAKLAVTVTVTYSLIYEL